MKLSILPINKCYSKVTVPTDKIATRLMSQVGDKNIDQGRIILFDQFNGQEEAELLNHQAVKDCIDFERSIRDLVLYKGLSIVDIDIRQLWSKTFVQTYRETFSLLNCVKEFGIKTVVIEKNDPLLFLFEEMLPQIGVELKLSGSFGDEDVFGTNKLKEEFMTALTIDFHAGRKVSLKAKAYTVMANFLAFFARALKGRKPFIIFSLYKPLEPIKNELLIGQDYYPMLHQINQLSFFEMVKCGAKLFHFEYGIGSPGKMAKLAGVYKDLTPKILKNNKIGVVRLKSLEVTIVESLARLLLAGVERSFIQIGLNIDQLGKIFSKNKIAGYFGFCDSPWEERLLVRMSQRENIPNAILINGVLSNAFIMEAKTADTVLAYGESQKNNYFKSYQGHLVVVGNPLYEEAYGRRGVKKIDHPPKKILVGTSDMATGDINCQYSLAETFLKNVYQALNSIKPEYDFEVSLKLHSGESLDFYRWLVKKEGMDVKEILSTGNMQEILMDYDLLIINFSVAVLEASLMGIPVLYYHPSKQVLYDPFGGYKGLLSAFSVKELKETLKRIFADKEFAYTFTDTINLAPFSGPLDGRVKDRIKGVLNNMAGS